MPGETPIRPDADRNLLFGILALQMDFINRDALIAAMNAWVLDKKKPLSQILLDQGAYRPEDRQLLEVVIKRHLELHHHDVAKSLAALSSIDSVRDDLERIADPEVRVSLAQLPTPLLPKEDPYATRAPSMGSPSSTGLRFRILRPHAKGGLGAVFVAHDEELHRDVALKEIQDRHADKPESRARFLQEAEITGGLEHPGIVPVYGLGQYADGRPFYAMRFIRGESLYDAIHAFHEADKTKRDPGERALALRHLLGQFIAACNAMGYAHARGVLHRDLKPDNIMLGKYGETLVVDWGLAKPVGSPDGPTAAEEGLLRPSSAGSVTPTQAGSVMGTPAYMSPEQAVGKLDQLRPASDVYSLGATLYSLLTGVSPFRGEDIFEVLVKVRQGRFPPPRQVNSKVPLALEAICVKAMALQPESRYRTAQALAADVEHWLADEPVEAYREPLSARLWRWARRHKPVVASVAVLLVSAVAALAVSTALIAREREKTQQQRDEARRYWYVGDMNLAQQAWEGADVDRVLRLLNRQRPAGGADFKSAATEDLRSFEWYYLWRLCHGARFTLRGHQSVVHAMAVSPDGRTIASGSGNRDRTVKLWDAATGRELATLQGHKYAIFSVAYTSDGQILATGDERGYAKLWNPATGQERRSFRAYDVGVMAMAFAPDGKTLATAGGDGKVKLWDTASGAEPVLFGGHKVRVRSIAFSPDGRMLASAGDDRTVVIWDAATGKELAGGRGHSDWIHSVAFAPDGKTVASGSRDGTVRIWDVVKLDVVKLTERASLTGHRGPVTSVRFAPDGKSLASASEDRTVKFWETTTWQEQVTRRGHLKGVQSVAFSPDGTILVTGSSDWTVKVWDLSRDPEFVSLQKHTEEVRSLAFSPDGKTLATGGMDKGVKLWDTTTGQVRATLEGHTGSVYAVAFAPFGQMLASGGQDQIVKLWDRASGKAVASLQGHTGPVEAVAFSPDGKILATGSQDSTVKLWDVATGQLRATLQGHRLAVESVAFAPDGRTLASGSNDQTVKLWDVATGKELAAPEGPMPEPFAQLSILSVAFSKDGTLLACGYRDGTVGLWDRSTGKRVTLSGHAGPVKSLAFAPDGKTLVSASDDKTVRLWDLLTAQERLTLKVHTDALRCVAFSPDGKILASASADGAVNLWEAAKDEETVLPD